MAKRTRSERDTAAVEVEGEDDVPEIVRLRRKNMARNAAMMAALNVGQSKPITHVKRERPNAKTSPIKSEEANGQSPNLRRSRRLKGDAPVKGDDTLYALPGTWVTALTYGSKGKKDVMVGSDPVQELYAPELSEAEAKERKKELQEHIDARDDGAAGTASYEHCLYRVRTMSDAALRKRVKAIERARGKHAAEKMLVFTRVLHAKGKDELCSLAEAALDRIVRGVPMPTNNETSATGSATTAAVQDSTAECSASSHTGDEKQR